MTDKDMLIGVAVDLLCRKLLTSADAEPRVRLNRLRLVPEAIVYESSHSVEHSFDEQYLLDLAEAILGQPDDPADLHMSAAEQRGKQVAISLAFAELARWVGPGESLELSFGSFPPGQRVAIKIELQAQLGDRVASVQASISTLGMDRAQASVLADIMRQLRATMTAGTEETQAQERALHPHEIAALERAEYYARSPETKHVALPAGVYICNALDEDGETELVDQQGGLWDPNANYGRIGMWVRDGKPVAYGDLKPGDTAVLLATVYLSAVDAEGLV
jgi:hypothetical protein